MTANSHPIDMLNATAAALDTLAESRVYTPITQKSSVINSTVNTAESHRLRYLSVNGDSNTWSLSAPTQLMALKANETDNAPYIIASTRTTTVPGNMFFW